MTDVEKIKQSLFQKLVKERAFWSFDPDTLTSISDETLIAESLIHLDFEDINKLFKIFGKTKIKKVWLEQLVPQGDYYGELNRLYSWFYFDIKYPDRYLKSMMTRHYNKLSAL